MTVYSVRCDCGEDSTFTLYDTLEKARVAADEQFEYIYSELEKENYPGLYTGKGEDHWLIFVPDTGISYDWYVEEHIVH